MARRPTRRAPGASADAGLPRIYEGPAVLSELLARAGSPFGAEEVAERFRRAQAGGEERADAIPPLFPDEPRFTSPAEARRLYGNLFGLWNRVAAGRSASDDLPAPGAAPTLLPPEVAPEAEAGHAPAPKLPERGTAPGRELPGDLVEAVWKRLDALPEREQRRLRHRFESAQPDLVAWLDAAALGDAAAIAAQDLAFETWAMFDVAFGDRVGAVPFAELRDLEDEPPSLETSQPALAPYVGEVLDLLAEEDDAFDATQRAHVERVVATIAAALGRGLEEE